MRLPTFFEDTSYSWEAEARFAAREPYSSLPSGQSPWAREETAHPRSEGKLQRKLNLPRIVDGAWRCEARVR
jgi:hypothetical protein